jgi:tetratricopeptide (TPR) repeat protein
MISFNFCFGKYYRIKRLFDSAAACYSNGIEGARLIADTRREVANLLGLAQTYFDNGRFDKALQVLNEVAATENYDKYQIHRIWYFDLMSSVLEKRRDFAEALHFRNEEKKLRDSIHSARIINSVVISRLKFEEEQNEFTIAKQREVISLKESVIQRQTLLLVVSVSLGITLLALAGLLYRFSQYQRKISAELDRKVFERTKDLKLSETELVRRLGEQKILLDMISARMRSSVATLRGLWDVAACSPAERPTMYSRFDKVTTELLLASQVVDRTAANKDVGTHSEQLQLALEHSKQ